MDQYTEILIRMSDVLSPDDDQYEEKLLAIASTFRSFSQALTSFLCANGFNGDASNIDEKDCYQTLIAEIEEDGLALVEADGIYADAEENMMTIIRNFLSGFEDFEIIFL